MPVKKKKKEKKKARVVAPRVLGRAKKLYEEGYRPSNICKMLEQEFTKSIIPTPQELTKILNKKKKEKGLLVTILTPSGYKFIFTGKLAEVTSLIKSLGG
jgi:hypothetical protein